MPNAEGDKLTLYSIINKRKSINTHRRHRLGFCSCQEARSSRLAITTRRQNSPHILFCWTCMGLYKICTNSSTIRDLQHTHIYSVLRWQWRHSLCKIGRLTHRLQSPCCGDSVT